MERWIVQARHQSSVSETSPTSNATLTQKRPRDWSQGERLNLVIACDGLDASSISALCRENGLFPHHIDQWKRDLVSKQTPNHQTDIKALRQENKALKKELNRKNKALAETAALLVLQKKSTPFGETARTADNEDRSHSNAFSYQPSPSVWCKTIISM